MHPLDQIAHIAREHGGHRHGDDILSVILRIATATDGGNMTAAEVAEATGASLNAVYRWRAADEWRPVGERRGGRGRPSLVYSRATVAASLAKRGMSL